MKNLNLLYNTLLLSAAFIFAVCIVSCDEDRSKIQKIDGSKFEVENRVDDPNRPLEIADPDEWILVEVLKGPLDWQEVKQWYRRDLMQRENDPSVPNLKSITVDFLVKHSSFLELAGKEDLLFFAGEIVNDDRVRGNPVAIAKILETAAGEKSVMNGAPGEYPDMEVMKMTAAAEAKYLDGADSAREEIKEEYEKSLGLLAGLHRNRWGVSQLEGVDQ